MDEVLATHITLATLALPPEGSELEDRAPKPEAFDRSELLRLVAAAKEQSAQEQAQQDEEKARWEAAEKAARVAAQEAADVLAEQAALEAAEQAAAQKAAERAVLEAAEKAAKQASVPQHARHVSEAQAVARQVSETQASHHTPAVPVGFSIGSSSKKTASPSGASGPSDKVKSLVNAVAGVAQAAAASSRATASALGPSKTSAWTNAEKPSASRSSLGTSIGGSWVPSFFPPAVAATVQAQGFSQAVGTSAADSGDQRSAGRGAVLRSRSRDRKRKRRRSLSHSRSRSRSHPKRRSSIFTDTAQASAAALQQQQQQQLALIGANKPSPETLNPRLKDYTIPTPDRKVVRMPQTWVKSLLGKGGETIRYIVNRSGANVQIKSKPGDADGIVSIEGNSQVRLVAEQIIYEVLIAKGCAVPGIGLGNAAAASTAGWALPGTTAASRALP